MFDPNPDFRALEYRAGYLPIEDFSLIGDGATCALVGRDGGIRWMCVPRFDSAPLFGSLLDRARGGHFTIAPEDLDNLVLQGQHEEAAELYASLCARASPTGLLPEQINPSTGEFMGNFPQAFSHIGVIFSGVTLAAAQPRS